MSNTITIETILDQVKATAPEGATVSWAFPGYISIILPSGTEIAFGASLDEDSGYTFNDFDVEGSNGIVGEIADLGDAKAIVNELWNQTKAVA